MAGSIDDIYFCVFVKKAAIFRINRNSSFLFNRIAVHAGIVGDHIGLTQKRIGQSCFSMIDMGDNRNISYFHIIVILDKIKRDMSKSRTANQKLIIYYKING